MKIFLSIFYKHSVRKHKNGGNWEQCTICGCTINELFVSKIHTSDIYTFTPGINTDHRVGDIYIDGIAKEFTTGITVCSMDATTFL